ARLVVDTGVHSKGWTREQALKYMHDYTALAEHEIETEVDRYIAWPGQALSYYMGELAIVRAREKAEKTLGAKFNIRAFHDAVLELGSVPLPVVTGRIDRFIAEGGKGLSPILSELVRMIKTTFAGISATGPNRRPSKRVAVRICVVAALAAANARLPLTLSCPLCLLPFTFCIVPSALCLLNF